MSLDDYSERVLAPCINNLAGAIAANIMSGVDGGVCNLVSNTDSNGNIISPILTTFLNAGATLDVNSAPTGRRKIVQDPFTQARTVGSLTGLLNPITDISRQYTTGTMAQAVGFEWMMDQTVLKHTTGTFTVGTVNGANQTGLTLTTNSTTGTFTLGDIITISGVNAVNRITKTTTGQLRQFVLTAAATTAATSLSIYPAIVPPSNFVAGGPQVQYQTVDSSPVNGATILLATPAGGIFRKNIAYTPEAITMATADLVLPQQGIVEGARESFDNISMRMITDYTIGTDQLITRLDVLYGYLFVRPEWVVSIADSI
jgi:coat protein Gp5